MSTAMKFACAKTEEYMGMDMVVMAVEVQRLFRAQMVEGILVGVMEEE